MESAKYSKTSAIIIIIIKYHNYNNIMVMAMACVIKIEIKAGVKVTKEQKFKVISILNSPPEAEREKLDETFDDVELIMLIFGLNSDFGSSLWCLSAVAVFHFHSNSHFHFLCVTSHRSLNHDRNLSLFIKLVLSSL